MPVLKNPRHEAFAQQLANGKPANEAYVMAGYKANDGNAARLKATDAIKARVAEIQGKAAERVEVSLVDIMRELERIGFADIRKAVKWDPVGLSLNAVAKGSEPDTLLIKNNCVSLVSSDELDDDTARAIAEVSQSPKGGLRIRFHDKRAALVELAKLKQAAQEKPPADQPAPSEAPRPTGHDHLERLTRRYAAGLRVIEGGAKAS